MLIARSRTAQQTLLSCSISAYPAKQVTLHPFQRRIGEPSQYSTRASKMSKLDITISTVKLPDGAPVPVLGYGTGTAWFKKDNGGPLDKKLVEATKKVRFH